jgi:hypothetical protein
MHTEKGRMTEGIGMHHATPHGRRVRRQRLVHGLSALVHRRCPLPPRLSRQHHVCEREQVPFQSTIDLMIARIQRVEPVAGTRTPAVLDRRSGTNAIGKAARERGVLSTTGLTCTRSPAISRTRASPTDGGGSGVIRTPPHSQLRMTHTTAGHVATKRNQWTCLWFRHACGRSPRARWSSWVAQWTIPSRRRARGLPAICMPRRTGCESTSRRLGQRRPVLYGDGKDACGLDQEQRMSAVARMRFWSLVLLADAFLDEEWDRVQKPWQRPVTPGEIHRLPRRPCLLWLRQQFQQGVTDASLCALLASSPTGALETCKVREQPFSLLTRPLSQWLKPCLY